MGRSILLSVRRGVSGPSGRLYALSGMGSVLGCQSGSRPACSRSPGSARCFRIEPARVCSRNYAFGLRSRYGLVFDHLNDDQTPHCWTVHDRPTMRAAYVVRGEPYTCPADWRLPIQDGRLARSRKPGRISVPPVAVFMEDFGNSAYRLEGIDELI